MPADRLPYDANLEHLRNQAKALHREVRAGDPAALERVHEHHPRFGAMAKDPAALAPFARADALLVIARQYGFPSWPRLRAYFDLVARYSRSPHRQAVGGPLDSTAALADEFLRLACLTYSGDHASRRERAQVLLTQHPEIATASIYTVAAVGDAHAAAALLAREPALVNRQGGPHQWEPLLYLTYARIEPAEDGRSALETARVLLAYGADPNAGYLWEGLPSPFTALTGALGEGEDAANQPPHPDSLELARLLLEAGADPNDNQALYNRQFRHGTEHLELLLQHGLGRGDGGPWQARLGPSLPAPAEMVQDQLLWATRTNMPERIGLLLAHGVEIDGRGSGHPAFGERTARELAVLNGHAEIAEQLRAAGADASVLNPVEAFLGACLRGDRPEVDRQMAADPTLPVQALAGHPDAMLLAAETGRPAAARLLSNLGFEVNIVRRVSALHEAAWRGDLEMVKELLELGADPTALDHEHQATAQAWALHNQQHEVAAYLEALVPNETA